MIIHDAEQGTPEWFKARCGIPTASCFDKILTAKTMKLSSQHKGYAAFLLAEKLLGRPLDKFEVKPFWMERGNQLEADAAGLYEFMHEVTTQKAGFITTDDASAGCSVDRFVGDEGILEIKCPAPWTHAENLMSDQPDPDYNQQRQGQLWITGRKWVDFMSYHPEMPPSIIRVERDDEYIEKLAEAIAEFNQVLSKALNKLQEK